MGKHDMRETIESENTEDLATDQVSRTALNKRWENPTIMYLIFYVSGSSDVHNARRYLNNARNNHHVRKGKKEVCFMQQWIEEQTDN